MQYTDLKVGHGAAPSASSKVSVNYTGWLVDGTKFDSSYDHGQPAEFPVNGVIKGWTETLLTMKVGGKRKVIIPWQLAYGADGHPPTIPAKADLVFEIELLGVK
jgi:FKBP-type peptidyl-prolyl cis-trans isomerase FkpA